jgi:hypothetical protein
MATVEELISDLVDFRTRSAAKSALLDVGQPAVPPLIEALDSRHASVRWAAVTILGELRAHDAIPRLIQALDDRDVHSAAVEALRHITGEDFGDDGDAWQRWVEMGATEPADEHLAGKSDDDLVQEAVYGTDISAQKTRSGHVLRVPLGSRHQDVTVGFRAKDSEGTPLTVVHTRCGPAKSRHYEWALRQNVRMSAGAIAIADVEGKPEFVIVDVWSRASVTPDLLIESVRRIARKGDQLEEALTKADAH